MDGETQSDSSAGSGSGIGGQETSDELLQALQSLSQKVEVLDGKVDSLTSLGTSSGLKFDEIKVIELEKGSKVNVEIPSGAKAMIFGRSINTGLNSGVVPYGFNAKIYAGETLLMDSGAYNYCENLLIPSNATKIELSNGGSGDTKTCYCFVSW